jgi:hypothetical protein
LRRAIDVSVDDPRFVVPEYQHGEHTQGNLGNPPSEGNGDRALSDFNRERDQHERHRDHVRLGEQSTSGKAVSLLVEDHSPEGGDEHQLERNEKRELEPSQHPPVALGGVGGTRVFQNQDDRADNRHRE